MKNNLFLSTSLVLLFIAMALLSISSTAAAAEADDDLPDCPICEVPADYDGPLTQTEVAGLLLALNDEYHAVAVYRQVLDDFGDVRPFSRIKQSEEQHIAMLLTLFDLYGVAVPTNPWPGSVPQFDSVQTACEAGVEAEVVNRDLYDILYATTDRADIEQVYQALQSASENNHLSAFERCTGSGSNGNGSGNGLGSGNWGVGLGRGGADNGNGRGRNR